MDKKYMKRALWLAEKGVGHVNPNPLVGAVIVKNGKIIGIWKRMIKTGKIVLETEFFNSHDKVILNELHEAIAPYDHFMNKTVEISHENKIF